MDSFLAEADGKLLFDWRVDPADARALELVNKTNQFNLNGRRYTEGEWRAMLCRAGAFRIVASYEDRFGRLGKIAVAAGLAAGGEARVETWVMSCRAFSRRIEHHLLDRLFSRLAVSRIAVEYRPTERNGPLRDFLAPLLEEGAISQSRFEALRPPLPHSSEEIGG